MRTVANVAPPPADDGLQHGHLPATRWRQGGHAAIPDGDSRGSAGAGAVVRRAPEDLRSHRWFGVRDLRSFGHRSRAQQMGYDAEEYLGRPVIGILNTWSELNPCHTHFRDRAEEVKRGVWQAGGFPVELPAMSLSEPFQKPTTMLYRNMLAMEAEELLRSHPVDGAVLMGGCDKTTPGLVMGATSMGLPFVFLPAGPMLPGPVGRRGARQRVGRVEVLGPQARRDDHRAGLERHRERHRPLARALHDDGHREHDDGRRRGARADPARGVVGAGGVLRACPDGRGDRPPDRGHGVGGPAAATRCSPLPPSRTPSPW